MTKTLQFVAIVFTAVAMAAGWAHLLALPNKMSLSHDDYLTVQQIYRGWALLGFVVVVALLASAFLAVIQRRDGAVFYFTLTATLCIALSLVVFYAFTFPANKATQNWTVLPDGGWQVLRRQWEYSHATGAVLYFFALASLTLGAITPRRSASR